MNIVCPYFKSNEKIPLKYTSDGENINPLLIVRDIPKETKTIAIVVDDPDSVPICGFVWIHWVVFNIETDSKRELIIPEKSKIGTKGLNSYGKLNYMGPSPPKGSGIHHYRFKVYALSKKINLKEGANLSDLEREMKGFIIERGELVGLYSRD